MKYCTSLHLKTHSLRSKKKNCSVETTAANNGQKKKLALKSQERCRRTWQALMVQTQLKTRPCRTLLKLNSKEMKWTPGHIFMLYYAVLAVFASGDRTYNISTSPFASMRGKVNTYIVALVVKMKLWRFSKRFYTNEPKRQWCRVVLSKISIFR